MPTLNAGLQYWHKRANVTEEMPLPAVLIVDHKSMWDYLGERVPKGVAIW